jgi:hypothetical protein
VSKSYTFEEVKNYINGRGFELLETEYKNNHTPMRVRCTCGNDQWMVSFKSIVKIQGCKKCYGPKTGKKRALSIDYVRDYIKSFGCELLSDNYTNNRDDLIIRFTCGHIGKRNFNGFMNWQKICHKCAGTETLSQKEVEDLFLSHGYTLLEEYSSAPIKMKVIDSEGYLFSSSYNSLKNGINRYGENSKLARFDISSNPYTLLNINHWLKLNNKRFHLIEGQTFKGSSKKLLFKCEICPEDETPFLATWNAVIVGRECTRCSGRIVGKHNNLKEDFPDLCLQWDYKMNGSLLPEDIVSGTMQKVYWICEKGHSYNTSVYSRTGLTSGCPYCSGSLPTDENNLYSLFPDLINDYWNWKKNDEIGLNPKNILPYSGVKAYWHCPVCDSDNYTRICDRVLDKSICKECNYSGGEYKTKIFLNKNNVEYIPQKKFPDCKDILPLMFDFYFPNISVALEINGEQHFSPLEYFGGQEAFEDRVKKDQIKRDYCKNNNIKLIEIPFWDFDKIESILTKELNLERKEVITL